MAITYFGSKKLMGTKIDRVSDSLGSSADGSNIGITLNKPLGSVTYGGSDITTDITWTQTVGTSTSDTFYVLKDTSNDLMDIKASGNCGTDGSPSIAYATLPSTLSTVAWTMRFKLVFNTVTAESTGGKSFFTNFFIVDSGTSSSGVGSENGFGFKFIADAGSTQTQFYSTTNGTDSGTSMSWTPASGNTIYVEISFSSGTATANFYSDSGYSNRVGSTTANATRSGTFSGLKFPQIALRQDNGGNGVMEIDMSELKIYDGVNGGDAKFTGAYSFDGSNDYVSFGSASDWKFLHDGTSNTVAFWVKRDGTQASSEPCVIDTQGASASYKGISFYWTNNSAGTLTYSVADGSGSDTKSVVCGDFADGEWHHVAVTYDGSNITSYKDGTQNAQTSLSGHTPSTADPSYTLHAGRNTRGSTYYKGDVDDIGIYKRVLTTTEISDLVSGQTGYLQQAQGNIGFRGNGKLNYKIFRKNSNESISYDIGTNLNATTWTCRLKLKNTSFSNVEGGANLGFFGISDKDSTVASDGSQDWIGFLSRCSDNGSSPEAEYFGHSVNDSTLGEAGTQMGANDIITNNLTTEWGWEIKRTGETTAVVTLYPNWNFTGTPTATVNLTVSSSYSALRYFVIRNFKHSTAKTSNLNGYIEEIKIWNGTNDTTTTPLYTSSFSTTDTSQLVSSLTNKSELKANYSMDTISGALSGIAPDDGGNANSHSNVSVDTTNKKAGTGSYDFADGGVVGNANQSYGISGTVSWTISCWIRPHAVGGNEALFRKQHTNGSSDFEFGVNSSNIFCWIEGQTTNMVSSPANNTWYHLVIRRVSGDKDYFYVNGSEVASTSTQNSIDDNSGFRWYLGRRKESGSETFNGNMDEWGIWNRALTTSEITALYNSGDGAKIDSISTTDLVIYWNFEQVPLAQQALPKCSNDASATSDLDTNTNLLVNSTFLQIDGTPQYYWKQSDNTWEIDGLYVEPAYSYILGGKVSGANINNITKGQNATDTMTMASSGTITTAQSGLCGCENDDNTNVYLIYHSDNNGYAKNIDKIPTSTDTPTVVDVGDMPTVGSDGQGASSTTHGYSYGGNGGGWYRNSIEKFSFSTNANGTDVGNMTYSAQHMAGAEDKTNGYGYHHGGYNGSGQVGIGRWSFTTDGNASSVGSLATSGTVGFAGGAHNETHVWQFGGRIGNGSWTDDIQKYAFGSSVSCSKIGDMSTTTFGRGAVTDDNDTAWISGGTTNGENTPTSNVVKYAFNVDSAETDIGDLPSAGYDSAGCDGK